MERLYKARIGAMLFAWLMGLAGFAHAQKAPNILIIWGDDIGGFNLSAYNQGVMG